MVNIFANVIKIIVLSASTNTFLRVYDTLPSIRQRNISLIMLAALVREHGSKMSILMDHCIINSPRTYLAISLFGSTVPTNTGLNWFIPALANRRVGSSLGMVEDECTYSWALFLKKFMNLSRI